MTIQEMQRTHLKNLNRPLEEIHNLIPSFIPLAITARRKSVDTSPVLIPLMFPEMLVCACVRQPVRIHIRHEIRLPSGGQDAGYVPVLRRLVAVCGVGAIAEIGPVTHQL